MSKKINIGLDIGISSVGWSIIDEDHQIIDLGVRLFNDVADSKDGSLLNEKRRTARGMRRRLTRIKTRKAAFKKFIIANSEKIQKNWIINEDNYENLINIDITKFGVQNPIELKVKALHEKISKEALVYILFHYIHHRGFFYLKEDELTDEIIAENNSKEFPSVKIYEFYKNNGYYKGFKDSNNFSAEKYKLEIREIFKVQGITDSDFIESYINIFSAVRDFATGPGSEKSPTPYGMWRKDENGNVKKIEGENLWDALIGKCTYYPNEKRGGKHSPVAELFNLINDINNIRFFGSSDPKYKLNKPIKDKIYESYSNGFIKKTFNLSPKNLIKIGEKLGWFKERFGNDSINEKEINGYRVDKKNKPIITELTNFTAIVKYFYDNKLIEESNICIFNPKLLEKANELFVQLAKYQDAQKRINVLKDIYPTSSDESNLKLIKSLKGLTTTHSLSYKAMNEFISFALNNLDNNDNQMQFFENAINKNSNREKIQYGKYLPRNIYKDEIISPTAKRAFNQSVNVLNAIIKKYGKKHQIDNITIELARDKNTAAERKNIKEQQEKNEKIINEICAINNLDPDKLNAAKKLRLKLWVEQDHKDIYDGKYISLEDVLNGSTLDIDHIIPFSISNDDSYNNKILTKTSNNKDKGNLTPYLWLSRKGEYEAYKERVNGIYDNKDKIENLLFEADPEEELSSFVARNLVDTRYSSRIVLNLTQDFFNNNKDKYGDVKIKVIRGKMTNFARRSLFVDHDNKSLLPKDRDIYCHHAIDASIICWLGMNHGVQKLLNYSENVKKGILRNYDIDENNRIINPETGEVINEFRIKKSIESENFGRQLAKYNTIYDNDLDRLVYGEKSEEVHYSRMMLSKNNVSLSNETVYSFRWNKDEKGNQLDSGNIINKIDLLKESNDYLDKLFRDEKIAKDELENLACYKSKDKDLYNSLKTIYNDNYKDSKENPFISYMKSSYGIQIDTSDDKKTKGKEITDIIRWIDINGQRVRSLKLLGRLKTSDNIIILKNHNNNAIMESLNALSIRIYKDDNNKYVLLPINQKVLTYNKTSRALKIDNEKLNMLLKKMNISNLKYIEVKNGTIFLKKNSFNNDLYYSNGGGQFKNNKLELKSLTSKNEYSFKEKRKQMNIALSSVIKDYLIVNIDHLGNIFNIKEIKI